MSTYIDMLRAHRAKQKAAAEKPGNRTGSMPAAELQHPRVPPQEEPLMPDDAPASPVPASPEAEEVSELARTALQQVSDECSTTSPRDALTYMHMLRQEQDEPGVAGPPTPTAASGPDAPEKPPLPEETQPEAPEAPSLSEEPMFQNPQAEAPWAPTPDAMMQNEHPEPDGAAGDPDERFGASLSDEATDQPHAPVGLSESNGATAQAAWLSGCVGLLLRIYEDAGHNVASDLSPLLTHLETFTAAVYEDSERLNALELEISNHIDEFRGQHHTCGDLLEKAIMMMLYGIKVCMQMHMEPPEITRQVAAAMLHNVGMALILVDTRLKEDTLSDVERALIRRTPEKSLEYLKDCGVTDPVLLQAAEQAQERFDGSGPQGLAGTDIALSARITGLLSMFEALVHFRAYRERLLPRDAIRELVNRYKNQFDPAILKVLIESVSLYPVGTYVQLNSGDVGQVIRVQPRLPMRPRVLLTLDRHGNNIQPREVDLRKQPNLMVQRCMYAAGLASLNQEEEKV